MIAWLQAMVCELRGHRDKELTPGVRKGAPMVECRRCGRIGWRMR